MLQSITSTVRSNTDRELRELEFLFEFPSPPSRQDHLKQATSYWETAAPELEFASDAVPGFPAYTLPACPGVALPLNGDPGFDAEPAAPGVPAVPGHVLVGAPFWPVVGVWKVLPAAKAVPAATSKRQLAVVKDAMMFFTVILPV